MLEERLEYPDNLNRSISPVDQVLMTLRFFATGNHLLSIADYGGMHVSTAYRIVHKVSTAIAELAVNYKKFLTGGNLQQSRKNFYSMARFPRVIGAIDGTYIKIQSSDNSDDCSEDAEVFRKRKRNFSINDQVVSDADLNMMNLVVRWPGSTHDATMFNNSSLKIEMENGTYEKNFLLGYLGYALKPYLLTPLLNPIGVAHQRYNEALIRSRNVVERMIGVWKRRFPVLAYGLRLKLENSLTVIVATGVLHNLAIIMGDNDQPADNEQLDILINDGNISPAIHNQNVHDLVGFNITTLINEYFAPL